MNNEKASKELIRLAKSLTAADESLYDLMMTWSSSFIHGVVRPLKPKTRKKERKSIQFSFDAMTPEGKEREIVHHVTLSVNAGAGMSKIGTDVYVESFETDVDDTSDLKFFGVHTKPSVLTRWIGTTMMENEENLIRGF